MCSLSPQSLFYCFTDEFVDQIPGIAEQVSPESIVDQVFTVTAEDCSEAFEAAAAQGTNSDGKLKFPVLQMLKLRIVRAQAEIF